MPRTLPEFEKPPVVEVALSVQFDRLDTNTAQLGLVWTQFRERFGNVQEKPELEPVIERFGLPKKLVPGVRFEVGAAPAPRLWFLNDEGNELVQLQRDRFIRNWRKTGGEPNYRRYENLREAFLNDWDTFVAFVNEEMKSAPVPNQIEVTYVNIVEMPPSGGLDKILACIGTTYSDDYLNEPESSEVVFRYVLKGKDDKPWGRLQIAAAPVIRASDHQPAVRLSLTARGSPPSPDRDGVMQAVDAGHEAVVRGFTSATRPEMHTVWGRK